MVLDGLSALLDSEDQIVVSGQVKNGQELLQAINDGMEADLVLLDINMPGQDGISILQELKTTRPEMKVILLSMYARKEFVREAKKMGTDGYLLKSTGREELLKALHAVLSGEKYFSQDLDLNKENGESGDWEGPVPELSDREKEVLRLMARGNNSNQISEELAISVHTVYSHRKSIASKLQTTNPADMVLYALRMGILKGFDLI